MPIDKRHGKNVPSGRDVAAILRAYFAKIGDHVSALIAQGKPVDLRVFIRPMVQSLRPYLFRYFSRGAQLSWRSILVALERRRRVQGIAIPKDFSPHFKAPLPPAPLSYLIASDRPILSMGFDVFLPEVTHQIDHMVFQFVSETLATAKRDAEAAYQSMREELRESMTQGESTYKITRRVQQIFNEPMRAFRIATTESSRAMHLGQLEAAQQSKVVSGLKWLASSDACPLCLSLDGKVVKVGEPFMIHDKGAAAYRVVLGPPAHPSCFCSLQEEIL